VMQIFLPPTHLCNKDEEDFLDTLRNTLASIVEKKLVDRQLILAKEKAESASMAKSTFLANMSHEVRTPMNGVIGMLTLLEKTRMTPMQRQYLAIAAQSAELQLSVINDILDFSKIEAGKLNLEIMPFDLAEVIESISAMLSGAAHNKGLELLIYVSWRIRCHLLGDAVRLRQVLINLVGNAIKFTQAGEVTLRADLIAESERAVRVRFHIIDTGIGISPEGREKIFQPFVQADDSTTRRFGGTGLGLVIAKQIVETMGGFIGLATQPGGGSVFWFEIEFVRAAPLQPADVQVLQGIQVLIVDDNDSNRTMLEGCFRTWNVACQSVSQGADALEALRRTPFDVVLLDMQMPDMSGLEVAHAIQGDAAIPEMKLLLLSAGVHPEETMLQEAGIGAYIMKPAGPYGLLNGLRMLLQPARESEGERTPAFVASTRFSGRVLLVEDTFVNQQVAAGMLTQMGLEVEIARDGQEGVDKAMGRMADVILMDMQMPVMDGLEATRRIRAWEKAQGREPAPIVAMTANALRGDRERCLEAGMNDYLAKPVLWEALAGKLAQWLPGPGSGGSAVAPVLLDHKVLEILWNSMKALPGTFTLVIEEFLDSSPALLATIEEAVRQQSPDQVRAAAHALKSNSATVGALALSALCATMEKGARKGEIAPAATLISEAREVYQGAMPGLRAALARENP
ncbi:MAG: response regulator, partial [Magnetococcales bacterium]|nr:response regulator [Magnetococcales bacterium]